MSNPYFKFKQFVVFQDRCAMKVGTDAVLLGAWCNVKDKHYALDIGTGTGILSLMISQKNKSLHTKAIDIDDETIAQAIDNINNSPFKNRIEIQKCDFNYITDAKLFDCIICNPPFYEEKVYCPDESRNNARHTSSLSFKSLINNVAICLSDDGSFSIIIPTVHVDEFNKLCNSIELYAKRRLDVKTLPSKQPKRTLLEYWRKDSMNEYETLCIRDDNNNYTKEYVELTKDFYL